MEFAVEQKVSTQFADRLRISSRDDWRQAVAPVAWTVQTPRPPRSVPTFSRESYLDGAAALRRNLFDKVSPDVSSPLKSPLREQVFESPRRPPVAPPPSIDWEVLRGPVSSPVSRNTFDHTPHLPNPVVLLGQTKIGERLSQFLPGSAFLTTGTPTPTIDANSRLDALQQLAKGTSWSNKGGHLKIRFVCRGAVRLAWRQPPQHTRALC
jgi:hypothetical protein